MDEKSLGLVLQKARQDAGLTQQQLCQKAGLSYSTLAKIERGAIKSPSIFTVQTIAQVVGLSLDQLLGTTSTGQKRQSKSGISFIYFDINGCLVRFFHRAFPAIAQDTGVAPDVIETAFWQYNDALCTGEISVAEFDRKFAKKLGVDKIDWKAYYMDAVEPIPEMHELLHWASQHYRIGLLSNIPSGFIDSMIEQKLLPNLTYEAIIDSSVVGIIKPDAKIYEISTKEARAPAGEILLVDDSRANLIPAQKRGWRVMWFNDYDPLESTERVRAALTF